MKTTIIIALLLSAGAAWADTDTGAGTSTGVQAVPSDQIKYPDASQVLNKTDPNAKPVATTDAKAKTGTKTPVTKLVAATPVPAQSKPASAPAAAAATTGWYLKWSLADEASARSWASSLGVPADVSADGSQWQVVAGPLTGDALKLLSNQTGKAVLIHK
jgi:hypothetical protein